MNFFESIVFIDEDNAFLPTREFAEAVRESDNYYVIVEDSNSGYEFFVGIMGENDSKVTSASGKSNIF